MDYYYPEICVHYLSDGTATVAKVTVLTEEYVIRGSGSSRRMAGDSNDPELGLLLAIKRALENVVDSLEAKTNRRTAVNDKKKTEAANYRTKEEWDKSQAEELVKAMESHPAGKAKRQLLLKLR